MSPFYLYVMFVLMPGLKGWSTGPGVGIIIIFGFLFGIIAFIAGSIRHAENNDDKISPVFIKYGKRLLVFIVILGTVVTLVSISCPSEKQVYTLAGAYVVTNDREIKKLPDNVLRAANTYLENLNEKLSKK